MIHFKMSEHLLHGCHCRTEYFHYGQRETVKRIYNSVIFTFRLRTAYTGEMKAMGGIFMNSSGSIITRASTAGGAIPVAGVTVLVIQRRTGSSTLLGVRTSDAEGRTTPVQVDTPDRELSESPSELKSWTDCDLIAEHPDYERVVVENVQVFPDTQTVQNFALIPREERPDLWGGTSTIEITPQEL